MGLIKNDKVKEQAIKHANFFHKRGTEANRQDIQIFECAIQFAETELQHLAIEFKNWCDIFENKNQNIGYFNSELFSKFIEQRNKS